ARRRTLALGAYPDVPLGNRCVPCDRLMARKRTDLQRVQILLKVRIPYFRVLTMLAKVTAKNQLTLPKAVTKAVGDPRYYEVRTEDGQIVLTPLRIQRADAVRAKLAELEITEQDVEDAVTWARSAGSQR